MVSTSILSSAVNKVGRVTGLAGAVLLSIAGAVAAQAPVSSTPVNAAPAAGKVATAPAAAPLVKPAWASLSPAQKLALEPLAGEWDRMEALRKQKWLDIANRFATMKPDEQARVHEKMREWVKMTPDERRLVRENYTKAKKLDASQKSAQWEKYQQLPEEQKQKLAAEAAKAKKQLTNLPPPAQTSANAKAAAPRSGTAPACPAGSIKNPAAGTAAPACVMAPVPAAGAPATAPAAAAATVPPATAPATAPAIAPVVPSSNAR